MTSTVMMMKAMYQAGGKGINVTIQDKEYTKGDVAYGYI